MATDPQKSVASQPLSPTEKNLPSLTSESDLADFSLRELLGMLLSSVGLAERKAYLERLLQDKPNGFYDRSLQLGTIPLDVRVPRTRSGDFGPASLPPLYRRGYSDEIQTLLLSLLSSARSRNAVKDALQKMGLSSSQQELEAVASIDRKAGEFRVYADHNQDGTVYCWIGGGTGQEQTVFLRALRDVLSPIDNPRYLLARRKIWRIFREDYFAVPDVLARRKELAEEFARRWNSCVGPAQLVYARTPEGRKLLLRARSHSLSGSFQKRAEQVSCWK